MTPATADQLLDEVLDERARADSWAEQRARSQPLRPWDLPEVRAAYWRYLTLRNPDELSSAEKRALSKASGPVGGFLVPSDLWQRIMAVVHARSSVGRVAREIVTGTGVLLNVPVASAHGSAVWIGESAAYPASSDETFAQVALSAFKAGTVVLASEELAADAVDFDRYLAEELGLRIAQLEGQSFVTGTGTGQPQGARDNVSQFTAATGSTTKFTVNDLTNALHSVPAGYRDGGAWIVSDALLKVLRQHLDSAGNPIFPSLNASPPTLFSYPVLADENLAAPAANAKSAMFLTPAAYIVRRVEGVSLLRQVELYSASTGQIGFRATLRTDGRVAIAAAGVTLAHSAT